jgi:hypothetical protein
MPAKVTSSLWLIDIENRNYRDMRSAQVETFSGKVVGLQMEVD